MAGSYTFLSATFSLIVVLSNILSAKMVAIPYFESFSIPAGLITYPLTFLLGDLVTEFFGLKKAKQMVYMALTLNCLGLLLIQFALLLPSESKHEQLAFQSVLGASGLRIFSSLVAFTISQLADVQLYAFFKRLTSSKFLWFRNNASTCISQCLDTVIIDLVYLYWGLEMGIGQVLPIMLFSISYKTFFSFANTPFFYLAVFLMRKTNLKEAIPTGILNNER